MAYQLDPDERISRGLARIGHEQIRDGIASLDRIDRDPARAVHTARLHGKKLRALIRLFRPELEAADAWARNDAIAKRAAKALTHHRDRHVALVTLGQLEDHHRWALGSAMLERVQRALDRRHVRSSSQDDLRNSVVESRDAFEQMAREVDAWRFPSGAKRALNRGFARTLRSARKGWSRAEQRRSAEALHRWRRHVKSHLYHMRVVAPIRDEDLATRIRRTYRLQKLLGEHHDLAVLDALIRDLKGLGPADRQAVRTVIQDVAELRMSQALRLGAVLFDPDAQ